MTCNSQPLWSTTPPNRVGRYLWRSAEGRKEYDVHVSAEFLPDEMEFCWRCWDLTDFTEMEAGGEWQFVSDMPVAQLPMPHLAAFLQDPTNWSLGLPNEEGRYLGRPDDNSAPVLVQVTDGVVARTREKARFRRSYGHSSLESFEAARRTWYWAKVPSYLAW